MHLLIDNADGIKPGVQTEIDTVKNIIFKSLYYFCDEHKKKKLRLNKVDAIALLICIAVKYPEDYTRNQCIYEKLFEQQKAIEVADN